jgi:hypothetical protein
MSLVLAAVLLGADGAAYVALGASMLLPRMSQPPLDGAWRDWLAGLYPSLFRGDPPHWQQDSGSDDAEETGQGEPRMAAPPVVISPLCARLLGYLLAVVGVCRLVSCVHWGCGYMRLGLATCLAEMGMLCNELLRFESLHIHRCMAVLMLNVAVSLAYIGAGLPYCRG